MSEQMLVAGDVPPGTVNETPVTETPVMLVAGDVPPGTPVRKLSRLPGDRNCVLDDATIIRRWLDGERVDLARDANLSLPFLESRMAALTARYVLASGQEYAKQVASVLVRIDHVESEARDAWEASKRVRRSRRKSTRVGPDGASTEESQSEDEGYGDPKLLAILLQCAKERAGLLGLDVKRLDINVRTPLVSGQQIRVLEQCASYRALAAKVTEELAERDSETSGLDEVPGV
jgi:hypothetical protein